MKYQEFIARKSASTIFPGIEACKHHDSLLPHQVALLRWSLRKGRAAVFADTGLGKTRIEIEWARNVHEQTGQRVLILAPLAVAQQTVREAAQINVRLPYVREDNDEPILVTNYDMIHAFDPASFGGIVLDESSILKAFDGKTRNALINAFRDTPFRLCATATPAPNDFTELGNHSEFLGVKTRAEMLSEYFVHDGGSTQDWRLKGHAKSHFWRWVSTWGAVVRSPEDLGFDGSAFILPDLQMVDHVVSVSHQDAQAMGQLFATDAQTLQEQRAVRRATLASRADAVASFDNGTDALLVWCELNDEADAITARIHGAIQVQGSDDAETKAERLLGFADGKYRVLVTKPSIAGFGMNWQHCHRMVFAGASHSYEQTYQAIRRCWRFGQKHPVTVYMVRAQTEGAVVANFRHKAQDAEDMARAMMEHCIDSVRAEVIGASVREWGSYNADQELMIPSWIGREEC